MIVGDRVEGLTEQFRAFIISACDTDPGPIVADGRWHRFRISDTRHKSSKPGRYLMHADGKANGIFMDWRDGVRHKWFGEGSAERLDRTEINRRRDERQVKQRAEFARAARAAQAFWSTCTKINGASHPYLDEKGIGPHGARYGSGELFGLGNVQCVIIPISGPEGDAMSLQAIRADGLRRFWPGSTHEGGHYLIGRDDGESPVVFCEGYSTAASIHEATGLPIVMCVNSGNMAAVARWAGHKWAGRQMIVAGDDDWHLMAHPKVQRNVGREAAEMMARALGGSVVMPNMHGLITNGGDDFNDMAREIGAADVAELFHQAKADPKPVDSPLPLIWFADNQPLLSGNWIIKNVLPAEAFCTIIGHPGCGKSFLALDMALHIAAGMRWQDRKTVKGLVLYLAAEGQRGQQNRVEAWKRHHEAQDVAFAMIPVAVNLRDKEADLPKLFDTIRTALDIIGIPLSVLVVDTLNRTFGGGDENGTDMSEYVANVSLIQNEFRCTTIVVHHIPKNAETVSERGHGSLRGAIETSLVVSADAESGVRTVLCKKQKDAEDGWKMQFKLEQVKLGDDEDGDPVTSCVVVSSDDQVAAARTRGPSLSPTQRQVYNELLATMEASGVSVPRDIPDDQINRLRVGKVVQRNVWRDRWIAIGGAEMSDDTAKKSFRRAVTDLQNKNLVGVWNDHAWPTFE